MRDRCTPLDSSEKQVNSVPSIEVSAFTYDVFDFIKVLVQMLMENQQADQCKNQHGPRNH